MNAESTPIASYILSVTFNVKCIYQIADLQLSVVPAAVL